MHGGNRFNDHNTFIASKPYSYEAIPFSCPLISVIGLIYLSNDPPYPFSESLSSSFMLAMHPFLTEYLDEALLVLSIAYPIVSAV